MSAQWRRWAMKIHETLVAIDREVFAIAKMRGISTDQVLKEWREEIHETSQRSVKPPLAFWKRLSYLTAADYDSEEILRELRQL